MKKSQALKHYTTTEALCRALGVAHNTVSTWGEFIPHIHQLRLESITAGYLRADDEAWLPAQPRITLAEQKAIVKARDAEVR